MIKWKIELILTQIHFLYCQKLKEYVSCKNIFLKNGNSDFVSHLKCISPFTMQGIFKLTTVFFFNEKYSFILNEIQRK